jgi:hypothetical protein
MSLPRRRALFGLPVLVLAAQPIIVLARALIATVGAGGLAAWLTATSRSLARGALGAGPGTGAMEDA